MWAHNWMYPAELRQRTSSRLERAIRKDRGWCRPVRDAKSNAGKPAAPSREPAKVTLFYNTHMLQVIS
jgi:hypothetical protein